MHALLLALACLSQASDYPPAVPGAIVLADHKHHEKPSPKPTGGEHRCPDCAAELQVMQDEIHALKGRLAAVEAELSNVKAQATAVVPAKVAPANVAPAPAPQPTYRAAAPVYYYQSYTNGSACPNGQCPVPSVGGYRMGPLRRLFGR